MNLSLTHVAGGLLVASLSIGASVAVTTLAQAQTLPATTAAAAPMPPDHPVTGDRSHGIHDEPGGRGMPGDHHMFRDLERLRTSLKLDASQTALWDKAEGETKPPTDGREQMKARRDRIAAMLDDPAFDPRKLAAEMDSADNARHAKMASMRDAWFAVYDSLNPLQRGQAREFLRAHLSHAHGMGEGREGWKHGRAGDGGRPSMPAPTH